MLVDSDSFIRVSILPQDSNSRLDDNIKVDLSIALQVEKVGWVSWFVNGVYRTVSNTINTFTFWQHSEFLRVLFSKITDSNIPMTAYSTWFAEYQITTNPKVVNKIFKHHRNGSNYFSLDGEKEPVFISLVKLLFPDLEFNADDFIYTCREEHSEKYRRFIHSSLSRQTQKEQISQIQAAVASSMSSWEEASKAGPVNISTSETNKYALEVVGRLFFGFKGPYEEFARAMDVLSAHLETITLNKKASNPDELNAAIDVVVKMLEHILYDKCPNLDGKSYADEMSAQGFSDAQIRALVFEILFTGQRKAANTLDYTILKLAQNPQLQKDVIDDYIGVESVIAEGLRMMTTTSFIERVAGEDLVLTITNLENNEKIKHYIYKGDQIIIPHTLIARNPRFIEKRFAFEGVRGLDSFDPVRWDEVNIPKSLSDLSWYPFGRKAHRCPGSEIVQIELKLILSELLNRFELSTNIVGEPRQKTTSTTRLDANPFIEIKERPNQLNFEFNIPNGFSSDDEPWDS